MRLIVLTVMGLMAGLGLAAAIVSVPVMANKGPQRAPLVAPLGGAQEEQKVQAGGNPDGRGRAVVKVFEEKLCAKVETTAIESSSTKATIHLGLSGEKGPTVANLQEHASTTSLPESTTPTTGTMGTTTGTTTGTAGTTSTTAGLQVQPRVLRRQPPAQLLPPRARRVGKQGRPPPPAIPHCRRLLYSAEHDGGAD